MTQLSQIESEALARRPSDSPAGEAQGTVEKAIDVLFHLSSADAPCGVTALGLALEMPKSSVHRLLGSLTRRGLVERDGRGRYRPGVGLVALGLGVLEREPTVVAARPVLERYAEQVGETFFLVGARAGSLVVLDKAEGTGFLRAAPRVGSSVPVHATAVGKLYLALAPESLAGAPASALETFTPRTLVDRDALERELAEVREHGLARNRDEWIRGLSVIAAPVFLRERLAAAVALAVPSSSLAARSTAELEKSVSASAGEISARLSGDAHRGSRR